MEGDWIRLNRKSLDSRVFSDPFLWQLWCWCLLRANWKSSWKHGRTIKPGQFVTGRDNAAEQLNCSGSKWYRGMKTLQEWNQIKLDTNSRNTLVTVLNWSVYQGLECPPRTTDEQPVNNQRTTDEQPVNTIEEGKERKKVKKEKNKQPLSAGPTYPTSENQFLAIWKSTPGVQRIRSMSKARQRSLKTRLAETIDGMPWIEALQKASQRKFPLQITVGRDSKWLTGDWILKPDSLLKIIEGKYDWAPEEAKPATEYTPI